MIKSSLKARDTLLRVLENPGSIKEDLLALQKAEKAAKAANKVLTGNKSKAAYSKSLEAKEELLAAAVEVLEKQLTQAKTAIVDAEKAFEEEQEKIVNALASREKLCTANQAILVQREKDIAAKEESTSTLLRLAADERNKCKKLTATYNQKLADLKSRFSGLE